MTKLHLLACLALAACNVDAPPDAARPPEPAPCIFDRPEAAGTWRVTVSRTADLGRIDCGDELRWFFPEGADFVRVPGECAVTWEGTGVSMALESSLGASGAWGELDYGELDLPGGCRVRRATASPVPGGGA